MLRVIKPVLFGPVRAVNEVDLIIDIYPEDAVIWSPPGSFKMFWTFERPGGWSSVQNWLVALLEIGQRVHPYYLGIHRPRELVELEQRADNRIYAGRLRLPPCLLKSSNVGMRIRPRGGEALAALLKYGLFIRS